MLNKLKLSLVLVLALFITACAGTKKNGQEQVVESSGSSTGSSLLADSSSNPWGDDANAWGTGYSIDQLRALGIDKNPLEYDTVYFGYDSSQIDERSQIIISAHSQYVATQSGVSVSLEGHTDERGTREYNLALGERRAVTVKNLMTSIGASNPISAITYGEERPAASGQNEESWQVCI